jgi:hypothetical protein
MESRLSDHHVHDAGNIDSMLDQVYIIGQTRLNRRQFVIGTGATLTAIAVAVPTVAASANDVTGDVIPGVIERIDPPDALYLRRLGDGSAPPVVEFESDASFWRAGLPVSLSSYVIGDEVVVRGQSTRGRFLANYMCTMYRKIEGEVLERDGGDLRIDGAEVDVAPSTLPWNGPRLIAKPVSSLSSGDHIVALCRRDPTTGELIAAQVGIRKDS